MPDRSHQIRMSDALWSSLGDIAQELGYEDKRGAHSALIREMVAAAAAKWRHSPYVCRSAKFMALVSKNGNVVYRLVQIMKLNADRQKLPCSLEMKPEKKIYYQRSCPQGCDQADWFRSRWLLNYFTVWQGRGTVGRRLNQAIDSDGTDSKMVDLEVNLSGGRFLTREILACLEDYVQWDEGVPGYDRADFPIDIPTHELKIIVAVDEDIYRHTATTEEEIPSLALEFRNRESARFAGKEVALHPDIQMEERSGRTSDDEGYEEVLQGIIELSERIKQLTSLELDDSGVTSRKRASVLEAVKIPEKFLFYTMDWRSPHLGIEACVRWEKPLRSDLPE